MQYIPLQPLLTSYGVNILLLLYVLLHKKRKIDGVTQQSPCIMKIKSLALHSLTHCSAARRAVSH